MRRGDRRSPTRLWTGFPMIFHILKDRFSRRGHYLAVPCTLGLAVLAGCALTPAAPATAPASHAVAASPRPADLAPYLELLARMAPGDETRQTAELAAALGKAQEAPTAANRLRYAIALGCAGHAGSNPIEARRLITELLAGQHDLKPAEVDLAQAFLREFDARVALYADIARQREELERRLQAADADGDKRYAALATENTRLKKALAEAERKLEAVAEMERTLIEQNGTTQPNDRSPPR